MGIKRLLPGCARNFIQGFRYGAPLPGKADFLPVVRGERGAYCDAAPGFGLVHADGADQRALVKLRRTAGRGGGEKQRGKKHSHIFFHLGFRSFLK